MRKLIVDGQIVEHSVVTGLVHKLVLNAPQLAQAAQPGQFIHLRIADSADPLLRRPFSISSVDRSRGTVTIIYRIVGSGTKRLAALTAGSIVNMMGPLGTGFALCCERPLLVGGGMGLAPLVFLAQMLYPRPIDIIMGGRTKEELFWPQLFKDVCRTMHITTDDGSLGRRGLTVDLLPDLIAQDKPDLIYACGPKPMLKKVAEIARQHGILCQVSLEEYMACGIGACLACTCAGREGTRKKVCIDGPVFWSEEVML